MERELRVTKLLEIQNTSPFMTGIRIKYKGEVKSFSAFKIPLDYLVYNKYNGRIGTLVKSFEKQYRELNAEDPADKAIIEKYLWDSKIDRNKYTMKSLVENGQQKYGIVTNDGRIIDGNRRASLLNRIWGSREEWEKNNHDVSHCQYFLAVILPDDADTKEIMKLETTYQMGEDEKLDYNPIEKYLKCKDLKGEGFSESDIGKMMGEKEAKIKEWLSILDLMEDYLASLGYEGIYTQLEKREGQFVDLSRFLKTYDRGCNKVDWGYTPLDTSDLKSVSFDYIRARYEGKEFRYLANPSKKEGIFCNKLVWDSFLKQHQEKVESIGEDSVDKIREENPDGDLSKLLFDRDEQWRRKAQGMLQGNLNISIRKLEDINESNQPMELLTRAKNTLESVNEDSLDYTVADLVKELGQIIWGYKKVIERKGNPNNGTN